MTKTLILTALLGISLNATALAQSPYTADSNTLFLYHFDEDKGTSQVIDNSGNNRNATRGDAYSGGSSSQPGMGYAQQPTSGLSARTNWTDPYAPTHANSLLYQLGSQEFTIEMWIKFDALNFTGNQNILSVQSGIVVQPDLSLSILKNATGYFLALGDKDGGNRVFTNGATLDLKVDEWYHIAVTATPNPLNNGESTYRFYFNTPGGDPEAMPIYTSTNTYMAPHAENTANRRLEIGNYYGSSGLAFFPGQIDELRISDVARTSFGTLQPIPEPSEMALITAAGAVLLTARYLKGSDRKASLR